MRQSSGKRVRTGVALSLTELCAADVRLGAQSRAGWRVALEPIEAGASTWPSLAAALKSLAEALDTERGTLVVALMPPLTEVRRLELPPLKREQVAQLLSRNAARYFVTAREPQVIGTSFSRKRSRAGTGPVLGTAASARLVNAITEAARESGWRLEAILPAEAAWASAATSIWPSFDKGVSSLLVHHADRTDLLQLEGGELAGVRRFRVGNLDAELIASALQQTRSNGTAPRVGTVGESGSRHELARALSGAATVSQPSAEWTSATADPMLVAATFASADDGLTLHTEDVADLRAARGRRITASLFGTATALLISAALLELWGAKRELAAVQSERAALKPKLESTLAGRDNFEASNRKLSALYAAQRQSPQLSGIIAGITDGLPEGAYILSFRARGDTLVLDGLAKNSGEAFAGLEEVPGLANVRSIAGIQRQLQDDGTALEHFTVQARMLLPVAAAPIAGRRR